MKKILLSGAILLASLTGLNAQWVQQTTSISNATGNYTPFIDVVDTNIVWALIGNVVQATAVAEFAKTVDGGNLWVNGTISNAANLAPSSIFGLNADTAWVAMWDIGGAAGKILRTDDGGATWNQQTTALFNAPGNFPDWVYFWDANNGVCLGDPPTGTYFEIYTTTDGGTNWVRTDSLDIPTQNPGEFGITDVFTHQGDSTIFYGTNNGRIYKSVDRGLHWAVAQTPFFDFIGNIAFQDANNGLCVSGGQTGSTDVAYTTDGGATWNLKGTNTTMNLTLGLCYLPGTDSTYFISTPANGSVDGTAFSPNGGTSWVTVDNLIHTDIEFANNSTGYTGSNMIDINGNNLMYKWSTPVVVPLDDASSKSVDVNPNIGPLTQSPLATFINNGLNTATFDVTMNITGGYTSTKTTNSLSFNSTQQVTFDPWTPAAPGVYTVTIYTSLGADSNHSNDTLQVDVTVFPEFENYGWTSMPPISTGAYGMAGAFDLMGNTSSSPGVLYSLGGGDLANNLSTMYAFFDASGTWAGAASMPSPKVHFSAQKVGNKIYCAGGYSMGFTADPNMYIYDPATTLWSTGAPMPTPLGDYAAGTYNDSLIYYINGLDNFTPFDIVQIYNTYTDIWSTGTVPPGGATEGSRGTIVGNNIIYISGFNSTVGSVVADAWQGTIDALNPTQITWTALPPYPGGPTFRAAAGNVFQNIRPLAIFTAGSITGSAAEHKNDCWGYDFNLNEWLIGPNKITPVNNLNNLVGLVYNDSLWMASVSGYDGVNLLTVNEWLNLGASLPLGINEHNAVSNGVISLYPNPALNEIVINIKENSDVASLKVSDVSGRIVKTAAVSKGQKTLRMKLTDLDAGVYILGVIKQEGNGSGYTKFVKE